MSQIAPVTQDTFSESKNNMLFATSTGVVYLPMCDQKMVLVQKFPDAFTKLSNDSIFEINVSTFPILDMFN